MAARLRYELATDVELVHGPYGQFKVFLDGVPIVEAGKWAALGVLPSAPKVVEAVRASLGET